MTIVDSLENKLHILGRAFRGLCKKYELKDDDKIEEHWCLTFIYKEVMVETPYFSDPYSCFNFAIKKLGLEE